MIKVTLSMAIAAVTILQAPIHTSLTSRGEGNRGQSVVVYFMTDRKLFQESVQDLTVSPTIINLDHSYLLLDIELLAKNSMGAGRLSSILTMICMPGDLQFYWVLVLSALM